MFVKFFKLVKLLKNSQLSFSIPKKKVIFFDFEGFESFQKFYIYIIERNNYFVLRTRINQINKIYCSFRLVFNFFLYLFKVKNFKIAYLISLILEINPKIVITNIDNSPDFSLVAKSLYNKIKFLAVQNAARYEFDEPFHDISIKKKYFIPELACFGNYEKFLYKKHNIDVKKFFVIGSLNLSGYIKKERNSDFNKKHDICLILEESSGWNNYFSGFEEALGRIAEFTTKFCKEKNLSLVLAGKRQSQKDLETEKIFYSKYINQEFKILPNSNYSSYYAVQNSEVTIGMMSTILREGLALNKKILACNFTGCSAWNFPINGICSFKEDNFEKFSERLSKILKLSFEDYKNLLSDPPSYVMFNDINQRADQKLKDRIQSIID